MSVKNNIISKNKTNFKSGKIAVSIYIIIISLILGIIILTFISNSNATTKYKDEAITNCIAQCKIEIAKGTILNSGPCISETIAPNWGCDIITSPKNQFIDDAIENQCAAYKNRTIKHLVQLTPECNFVKAN